MWLVHLVLVGMALYVAVLTGMYFAQTWLIFPTTLVEAGHVRLPASAQRLEIEASNGDRLVGVHLPGSVSSGQRRPLLLGFGGMPGAVMPWPSTCTSASLIAAWSPSTIGATGRARGGLVQRRC